MNYSLLIYQTATGRKPFDLWFEKLKDTKTKTLILDRIDRVQLGNLGDAKSVGDGVSELRLHGGPGYRLYYAKSGTKIILLLCGGSKSTQEKDIAAAKRYWADFQARGTGHGKNQKK